MEEQYSNPIVYRCVNLISNFASSCRFNIQIQNGRIDETDILFKALYNSYKRSFYEFMECFYSDLILFGEGYLVLRKNKDVIQGIDHVHSHKISREQTDTGKELYIYTQKNKQEVFPIKKEISLVFSYKNYNPYDKNRGFSPLNSAKKSIKVHEKGANWTEALLENAARPSGALIYTGDTPLTQEQFERLRSEFYYKYQGDHNAGNVLLLENGLSWKSISMTPSDMDFISIRQDAAREIALSLGVPPMLLGFPGDNTYSNFKEAKDFFLKYTINPLVYRVSKSFQRWARNIFKKRYLISFSIAEAEDKF